MAQYSVYELDGILVLDIQSDLLDGLNTRMVVPLLDVQEAPKPITYLNPQFVILDRKVSMATQFLASVPQTHLKRPIANLSRHHDQIVRAIDLLFHGF